MSLAQCEPHLAHLPIAAIDGKAIQAMVAERRKIATPATVRRDLTAVSRVLEFAEAMEWREGNPTLSKRRLLKERRDPIVLPESGVMRALLDASSPRFAALIQAALLTGCRQAELTGAQWKDLDMRAGSLALIGKGNKRRTISLSAEAVTQFVLARKIARRTGPDDTIFQTEAGEPFRQAASDFCHVRRLAERKAKMEGRPFRRFRFHDLRHLFAVEALRNGMGIYALSKHLGHTSVKTTEVSYLAFLTPEEAQRAKDKAA